MSHPPASQIPAPQAKDRDLKFRERISARIIAATEAIIVAEGLSAVQARRIATDAGCSVGTIYNIFGDIDGLILGVNTRTLHALGEELRAAQRRMEGQNLEGRLMALAVAYLDFATVNRRRWRAVFEHRLPESRDTPPDYVEDRRALLALIEAELAAAIPDPAAREDAAHALFAATHGNVLLAIDEKLGPFEPDRCERQIRFLVHAVTGSIGAAAEAGRAADR